MAEPRRYCTREGKGCGDQWCKRGTDRNGEAMNGGSAVTDWRIPAVREDDQNFMDLSGKKKGMLTVIKYAGSGGSGGARGARWLVRCVCGNEEICTTRTLQQDHPHNKCSQCNARQMAQT